MSWVLRKTIRCGMGFRKCKNVMIGRGMRLMRDIFFFNIWGKRLMRDILMFNRWGKRLIIIMVNKMRKWL